LEFRDGGRLGANAIALPGGTIILTDQLVALAKSEDEIAGVLAHEIGHVTERHSLRQIYRALGIGFMAAVIIGDTSQLLDNVIAQAAVLDTLSYSRQFERDADAKSVELMTAAGRDPVAFISLLDRIFEKAGVDSDDAGWLSTHPGNENRREEVQKKIDALGN
jgi:predicted Zn-dependent protease